MLAGEGIDDSMKANNEFGIKDEIYEWWDSFDDPYKRLESVARYLIEQNPEATFYDLFNFIREDLFKGFPYDEDSTFIRAIDFDIRYRS